MALWRGFKAHAVWMAQQIRAGIKHAADQPLDVGALAERYQIDMASFSQISCPATAYDHFRRSGSRKLSGFVVPVDGRYLMTYNDTHPPERVRSTIAHEASHVALQHEPQIRVSDGKGCDAKEKDQEDEAAELSGELLIPRTVATQSVLADVSAQALAQQFRTSVEMAQWRMNVSGGYQIRRRSRTT